MENNDYLQNYQNYSYQNPMNQMNKNSSPFKDNKMNQSFLYQNNNSQISQNGNYFNNQFPYLTTPKKTGNLYEPDTLLSPIESNSKNDMSNNNALIKNKNLLNIICTPFKSIVGNNPYNGTKFENKS